MDDRRAVGQRWEREAETFLRRKGLRLLERNFHCRGGEIDLVMLDRDSLVFVEVRYRTKDSHGSGAESVGLRKQSRLINAARYYLMGNRPDASKPCRFDVISVSTKQGKPCFEWIRHAFEVTEG
jgi:putative endonuclease